MSTASPRRFCLGLRRTAAALSLALATALGASADDWPYWRGLHQDGISRETGLLKTWPAEGPRVLWKQAVPGGYSSFAVAQGRLYTMSEDRKEEIVLCLDATSGKQVWEYRYPADYDLHPGLDQRFKSGPRSTPVVDAGHVYALGTTGVLNCLEAKTGRVVWTQDLLKLGERPIPEFGYSNSPFIAGDRLFVQPGGTKGNSLAALDKRTGKVLWKGQDDPIGYATPILIEAQGQAQVVYFTAAGIVAVRPADGQPLWRFPWKTNYDLNVATPIYAGGQLFLSSNYGRGAAMLRLKPEGPVGAEEVYRTANMQNHFSTSVLYRDHLYGFSNDRLRCVEWATGEIKWDQRGLGRGSLLLADGHLFALGDKGDLVLAEATPAAYVEKGRFRALPQSPCWTGPVLANGRLYVRNETEIVALDVGRRP